MYVLCENKCLVSKQKNIIPETFIYGGWGWDVLEGIE